MTSSEVGSLWAPRLNAGDVAAQVAIKHFSDWDVFEWTQAFPSGCNKDFNVSALPDDRYITDDATKTPAAKPQLAGSRLGEIQYQSATFTSAGLPSINASAGTPLRSKVVGYAVWRGTWSWSGFSVGSALSGWQGGTETGPTVLWRQAAPAALNGSRASSTTTRGGRPAIDAVVLSASDDFFTGTLGKATCRLFESSRPGASAGAGGPDAGEGTSSSHHGEKMADGSASPQNAPPANLGCTLEENTDYWGHDVASLPANSSADCCSACRENKLCTGFTFLGGDVPDPKFRNHCYLKASRTGRRTIEGHVSGYLCSGEDEHLSMGVQGYEQSIEPGRSFSFVMAPLAGSGIQAAVYEWGAFLQAKHQTKKLANDVTTMLGFGTDNGAWISDHQWPFVNASLILEAFQKLGQQGVHGLSYLAFDPWWYRGNPGWVTSNETFPEGLPAFAQQAQRAYDAGLEHHGSGTRLGGIVASNTSMMPLLLYSSYWNVNESERYPPYGERGFKFLTSRKYVHSNPLHPYVARFGQSDGRTSSAFYEYIYGLYADDMKVMVSRVGRVAATGPRIQDYWTLACHSSP